MGLMDDLRGLSRPSPAGWKPDAEPRFGQLLVDRWHTDTRSEFLPPAHPDARFRHSDAGACSRVLAYKALGIPRSNPVDASGDFIMRWGIIAHEQWQEVLQERFPGAEVEVKVTDNGETAGHIDAVVSIPRDPEAPIGSRLWAPEAGHPDYVVSIEAKTVGGFAFKNAIGIPPASHTPRGPSYSHVLQAALNAKASHADEAVILYWSREAISVNMAAGRKLGDYGRVLAEWTLSRDEYEQIVAPEIVRIYGILDLVDAGTLPARKIPDPELPARHIVIDPAKGEWSSVNDQGTIDDAGVTWHCAYCGWRDICVQTPAHRAEIAEVPVLVELLKDGVT